MSDERGARSPTGTLNDLLASTKPSRPGRRARDRRIRVVPHGFAVTGCAHVLRPSDLAVDLARRLGAIVPATFEPVEGSLDEYFGGSLGGGGGRVATVKTRLGEGSVVEQGELSR